MNKLTLLVCALICTAMTIASAQHNFNQPVQNVISSYLEVKNNLVNGNGDSVRIAAKNLYKEINNVPSEKLNGEAGKAWRKYSEQLSYHSEHIKQTDDIVHQREHFAKLSVNFYAMLKAASINLTELYYQFCPMADDGKGAFWLSETEKISNPYFGNKMLRCGSTKEILKPIK